MNMFAPARSAYQTQDRVSTGFGSGLARPRATVPAAAVAADRVEDGMASLDGIGLTRSLERGQELFAEGDRAGSYYKVISGAVRLLRLMPDGRRHVVDFFVTGDYFGFTPLQTYPYSAEAVIDAVVVAYPRRGIEDLIIRRPGVGSSLLAVVSRELAAAQEQLLLLGRKTAQERLASFLLLLLRRAGQADAARPQLDLFMTRTDIADHLGLTVETVSRGLSQLRRQGIIALPTANRVLILKLSALERLQEGYVD
jgi:CRP/FNR family transcriptional regulator, anaerobic regulatory protein